MAAGSSNVRVGICPTTKEHVEQLVSALQQVPQPVRDKFLARFEGLLAQGLQRACAPAATAGDDGIWFQLAGLDELVAAAVQVAQVHIEGLGGGPCHG